MLANSALSTCHHISVDIHNKPVGICNKHVGIDCQLGLKKCCQRMPSGADWTHVEDLKDPSEFLLPTGNLIFVVI